MSVPKYNAETALAQIDKCEFECMGGPLANNVAYRWLKERLQAGPKFLPGQKVWFEIVAEAAGKKLFEWVEFVVVGVSMSSDTERQVWTYSISYDPPQPWHYGTTHFTGVKEKLLFSEMPQAVDA